MIKNNKWKILFSSLAILIPSFAALLLKDRMIYGMRGAWYFTWIMPLIMLVLNVVCILITLRDNRSAGQNQKILNMMYFIMPCISMYSSGLFIALGMGLEFDIAIAVFITLGVSLIIIGNYMPKAVRNRTFGVKIKWTLANDANWAATHRFAGKLWVILGIAILLLAFIPSSIAYIILIVAMLIVVIAPVIYSYSFYKKQLASGDATKEDYAFYPHAKSDKKMLIISLSATAVVLLLVAIMTFVGNIDISCGDDALEINTSFGGGMELAYDEIVKVEYRDETVDGRRVSGFGSAKLLFGWFKNEEFGTYTRYTYTDSDHAIVIYTKDDILVIAEDTAEDTRAIYDELLVKISKGE